MKKIYSVFLLIAMFVYTNERVIRRSDAGGRVELPSLVRPPARLRNGETTIPPPGWTRCVNQIVAKKYWRNIDARDLIAPLTTQFQCTWIIQSNSKIQIAIQKLQLGNGNDLRCIRQFLEIVDNGVSQGRYCENQKPGDYVTLGKRLRLDIQGVESLSKQIRLKRNPFTVAYRAVVDMESGFRTFSTKVEENDPGMLLRENINTNHLDYDQFPRERDNTNRKDENDEENKYLFGDLTVGGLVGIIICCLLILGLIVFIVIKVCCCKKEKTSRDKPFPDRSTSESWYPPPHSKTCIPRPIQYSSAKHYNQETKVEAVIKEETALTIEPVINKKKNPSVSSAFKLQASNEKKESDDKNKNHNGLHNPTISSKKRRHEKKVTTHQNNSETTNRKTRRKKKSTEEKKQNQPIKAQNNFYPARRARRSKSKKHRKKRQKNSNNQKSDPNAPNKSFQKTSHENITDNKENSKKITTANISKQSKKVLNKTN